MLIQFTVGNFLSFHEKATLSLLVPKEAPADPRFVESGTWRATRVAAIYGANGSGKSNFVKALEWARDLVLSGTRPGDPIAIKPFKLIKAAENEPSSFEFDVVVNGLRYSYGFVVRSSAVIEEWLFEEHDGVEKQIFIRERDPVALDTPQIDASGIDCTDERRSFIKFVADGTRPNQLFLTEAMERNVHELYPLFGFFRTVHVVPMHYDIKGLATTFEKDPSLRDFVSEFLRTAGTGVASVEVEKGEVGAAGDDEALLRFRHETLDPAVNSFRLDEESEGTRRLLTLAPRLSMLRLRPAGLPWLHVADEIERSLHPLLTRLYIESFQRIAPENSSQLLVTTHDTNLLDLDLLSRHSIWFTEKDRGGASTLYPLTDFKPDQLDALASTIERGYLVGRFGAIPFLADPTRLGWVAKT